MTAKLKVVDIEWIDSASGGGWQEIETITTFAAMIKCRTVGFLITEDDDSITIAASVGLGRDGNAHQADNSITIPKVAITKRRSVKLRG